MNLFHKAIREYDIKLFNQLLETYRNEGPRPDDINGLDKLTRLTPFQLACFYGHFDMAVKLLVHGANPNIRKEDSLHVLQQIAIQREWGPLYANLIFFAPDADQHVKNSLLSWFTLNPEIFHVLFWAALEFDRQDFALELLRTTLPSLPVQFRNQIEESLTGALFFAVSKNFQAIAATLVKVGVRKIDSRLPDRGVSFLASLPASPLDEKDEPILPLSHCVAIKDYIGMSTTLSLRQPVQIDKPNAMMLPWALYTGYSYFEAVNQMIEKRDWKRLEEFEQAGYSLNHHLYLMIMQNKKDSLILQLKDYPRMTERFYDTLRKMFLLAICDTTRVNEFILDKILVAPIWPKEASQKDKLIEMEKILKHFKVGHKAFEKFKMIKEDLLKKNVEEKSSQNGLMRLPVSMLHLVTEFVGGGTKIHPEDKTKGPRTYQGLACTGKYARRLAAEDRLAYPPSAWLRFNDLDIRINKINNIIAQLEPYKKMGLRQYYCEQDCNYHGTEACCTQSFCIPFPAMMSGVFDGCSFVCCIVFPMLDKGANFINLIKEASSLFLWGSSGVPLSLLCCAGSLTRYYCCDSGIPGSRPDELKENILRVWEDGAAVLPADTPRPTDTKALILALNNERDRLNGFARQFETEQKAKSARKIPGESKYSDAEERSDDALEKALRESKEFSNANALGLGIDDSMPEAMAYPGAGPNLSQPTGRREHNMGLEVDLSKPLLPRFKQPDDNEFNLDDVDPSQGGSINYAGAGPGPNRRKDQ